MNEASSAGLADQTRRRYSAYLIPGTAALLLVDLLDVALPLALKAGFDALQSVDPVGGAGIAAAIYLGMAAVQAALRLVYRRSLAYASISMVRDIRDRVVDKTVRLPFSIARRRPVGETLTMASSDSDNVGAPFDTGIIMLTDGLLYLLCIPIIMAWLAPEITLIVILPIFAVPFVMARGQGAVHGASLAVQQSLSEVSSDAHEAVAGIETVKAFAQEERLAARFSDRVGHLKERAVNLARIESITGAKLEVLSSISTALLLLFGGAMLATDELTLGTFVALLRYLQQLTWPTQALSFWLGMSQRARGSEERIEVLLALPEEERAGAPLSVPGAPALDIRNLTYTYPGAAEPVLRDLSLTVRSGERLALLGDNASGKTTLLYLLARLYEPPRGTIYLDGRDILDIPLPQLRGAISAVLQEPFLFSGTVADNVADLSASGRLEQLFPGGELGADPLRRAVQESGHGISGGQRQRITLARALGKESSLLLLDDALSAVDLHTERRVIPLLDQLTRGRTVILVSQRLPAIALADSIAVMQSGEIVQRGTAEQLLRDSHGWYSRFHRRHTLLSLIDGASAEEKPA